MCSVINTCINVSTKNLIAKSIKNKSNCEYISISPVQLIGKVPDNLKQEIKTVLDKNSKEFQEILKGANLGLTAYQKPTTGIPLRDLHTSIQNSLSQLNKLAEQFKSQYQDKTFGQVKYNTKTGRISFYSPNDINCTVELGGIDVPKQSMAIDTQKISYNINKLMNQIPIIRENSETLIIETNA